ncbi:hypothetical protein WA026_020421 [Henosepilachna vigintioctopunctata]|uniref:Uncharacterized protein n=1 Tax=Henosepilachna vigintioctopunctata TaxID=420089 RepID=A0AAW1UGW9_9CUCU
MGPRTETGKMGNERTAHEMFIFEFPEDSARLIMRDRDIKPPEPFIIARTDTPGIIQIRIMNLWSSENGKHERQGAGRCMGRGGWVGIPANVKESTTGLDVIKPGTSVNILM